MTRQSAIVEALATLARFGAVERGIGELSQLELAAIGADWELWQRPNQAIPPTVELGEAQGKHPRHDWPLWGRTRPGKPWRVGAFIGARGTGKTTPIARYVHAMAMSLEWERFLLVAQGEKEMIKIFVEAKHGLIKGAPPWERPYYTAATGGKGGRLIWPSGAEGILTCCGAKFERGTEYDGAWCTELTDWPASRRVETWGHVIAATRQGNFGHVLVDSTPSEGHPVLEDIKEKAETNSKYWWVRHNPADNVLFLIPGYYDDLSDALAGTPMHDEEVKGLEGKSKGLVETADIEAARRQLASLFERRIVVLDPTGADPKTSDKVDVVGLMGWGLCKDQQLMPTEDRTGHMDPEEFAADAVEMYITGKCDCMVIETDRGGVLPSRLIQAAARDIEPYKGEPPERTKRMVELRRALNGTVWHVIEVSLEFQVRYQHGTIYVRQVHTWADKPTRASLLAQQYKKHRVSHPYGVDLDSFEKTLTTHEFKPRAQSPGDFDCGSWAVVELLDLYRNLKMGQGGQRALVQAARERQQAAAAERGRPVGRLHPATDRRSRRDTRSRI